MDRDLARSGVELIEPPLVTPLDAPAAPPQPRRAGQHGLAPAETGTAGRGAAGASRAPAVLAGLAVVLGAVVCLARLLLPEDAVRGGALVGLGMAVVCVPSGVGLLLARRGAHRTRRLSLLLFGVAMAGYGLGQAINGLQTLAGTREFPSVGDLIASTVTPLLLVAFATAPSLSRAALPVTRLIVDGALLGTATALVLWELVVPLPLQGGDAWPLLLVVVVATGMAATLPLTAAVRDGGLLLATVALSVVLFASVDGMTIVSRLGVDLPAALPVLGLVVHLCLPGPMALAMRSWARRAPRPPDPSAPDTDARTTTTVSTLTGALLVVVLLGSGMQEMDTGALGLCVAVVVLVVGREVLLVGTQRRLLAQLTRQVMTDPLTGLHSSVALRESTSGEVAGVVVLDIAGLDSVNQVYGRAAGDELVRAVGVAVSLAVPSGATCFRMGGDELAVVLPVGGTSDAMDVAATVQAAVARQVRVRGTDHAPRLALGVARADGGCTLLATVLEDAVGSMHLAQQRRSHVPVLHDATRSAVRHRRTALEQRLPAAVAAGTVTVLAQPVVDLGTGIVVGVEALARWHDELLGHVSPVEFVEAAEHTGVIDALGEHVLRTAATAAADSGLLARGLRLSVNVSPIQLRSARLVGLVAEVMAEHRFAHGQLTLEVTESVLLDEDGPALDHLHALCRMGVAVAIDDFGAGHASLGYLRRVPAHVLKLDRSLVVAAGTDPRARAVLQAGLELCAGLGMLSVVEGVETSDVALDMSRLGADLGQGWLWSPAVPFEALAPLLDRSRDLTAQV